MRSCQRHGLHLLDHRLLDDLAIRETIARMIELHAHQTVIANDQGSSPQNIDQRPEEPASSADRDDRDDRQDAFAEPSGDASQERDGAVPLLGLEPATAENTGFNSKTPEVRVLPPRLAPLLGTRLLESAENLGKSSTRRSPERLCYGKLLRETDQSSPAKPQRTVLDGSRGCDLASSARWRTSTSSNLSLHTASFRTSIRYPLP